MQCGVCFLKVCCLVVLHHGVKLRNCLPRSERLRQLKGFDNERFHTSSLACKHPHAWSATGPFVIVWCGMLAVLVEASLQGFQTCT